MDTEVKEQGVDPEVIDKAIKDMDEVIDPAVAAEKAAKKAARKAKRAAAREAVAHAIVDTDLRDIGHGVATGAKGVGRGFRRVGKAMPRVKVVRAKTEKA